SIGWPTWIGHSSRTKTTSYSIIISFMPAYSFTSSPNALDTFWGWMDGSRNFHSLAGTQCFDRSRHDRAERLFEPTMVQQSHHRHPAGSEKLATIERGLPMTRDVTARPRAILPANKLSALVLGAAAIGALAIGALAIGHVAVGRLVIRKA